MMTEESHNRSHVKPYELNYANTLGIDPDSRYFDSHVLPIIRNALNSLPEGYEISRTDSGSLANNLYFLHKNTNVASKTHPNQADILHSLYHMIDSARIPPTEIFKKVNLKVLPTTDKIRIQSNSYMSSKIEIGAVDAEERNNIASSPDDDVSVLTMNETFDVDTKWTVLVNVNNKVEADRELHELIRAARSVLRSQHSTGKLSLSTELRSEIMRLTYSPNLLEDCMRYRYDEITSGFVIETSSRFLSIALMNLRSKHSTKGT